MRAFVLGAIVVGVLGFARPAQAQFQNHSIGFNLGYIHLSPGSGFKDALLPPAFALDATIYIESGFDVGLRFGFAIQHDQLDNSVVLLYPAAMMRWFIFQDYFRPYIGANLEYVHAFDSDADTVGAVASDNYIGIGPTVGFEYFFTEDWSIGLNGEFAGYFSIGADPQYSIQVWARIATHF